MFPKVSHPRATNYFGLGLGVRGWESHGRGCGLVSTFKLNGDQPTYQLTNLPTTQPTYGIISSTGVYSYEWIYGHSRV